MVIEHVFVTTLDAPDALRLASSFLTDNGFVVQGQTAFHVGEAGGAAWNTLEVVRGKANAARAKTVEELPQRLKIEWDRGRVTVAAYIQAFAQQSLSFGSGAELPSHSPKARLHAGLMTAIVQGLEILLAHQRPAEEALGPWRHVLAEIEADARQRRRRTWTTLTLLLVLLGLLIGLVIFANTR